MRFDVQDGCSTYFWFDNWLGLGKLLDQTGELGIRYLGIEREATVAAAASGTGWRVRSRGQWRFPEIYAKLVAVQALDCLSGNDKFLWRQDNQEYKHGFSSSQTWNQIRTKKQKVPWRKLVWFSQEVPRQSFMVWLAFNNRLSTWDRMRTWGIEQCCMF